MFTVLRFFMRLTFQLYDGLWLLLDLGPGVEV